MEILQFDHPEYLLFAIVVGIAAVAASLVWFRRRMAILRFFGNNSGRIYGRKRIVSFLALFCLIPAGGVVVLSGPYYAAQKEQDVFEPLLIVIAQDISKSMLAPISANGGKSGAGLHDEMPCVPTRLQVAGKEVLHFVEKLEEQQRDKVGLVVFARFAYPAIPVPTGDYLLFKRRFVKETLLENVLTMAEGSNHWAGVERALHVFEGSTPYRKLVIIVTDGDPEAPPDILAKSRDEALAAVKMTAGVRIYTVGIGEPGTVLPVPLVWQKNGCPDPDGGFMKQGPGTDRNALLLTETNPEMLQNFSNVLGGTYVHASRGTDLAHALKEIVSRERVKTGVMHETVLMDLGEPLLLVLLGMLGLLVLLKRP